MFMFICSLLVFPDIPSWTVCQQEDGDDDAHQEQYRHIEPQGARPILLRGVR